MIKMKRTFNEDQFYSKEQGYLLLALSLFKEESKKDMEDVIEFLEEVGIYVPKDEKARNLVLMPFISRIIEISRYLESEQVIEAFENEGYDEMILSVEFDKNGVDLDTEMLQLFKSSKYIDFAAAIEKVAKEQYEDIGNYKNRFVFYKKKDKEIEIYAFTSKEKAGD